MKPAAIVSAGAASTGVGIAVAGWAAVAVITIVMVTLVLVVCWVLANSARTARFTRIVSAMRGNESHPSRTRAGRARADKTLTR